MKPGKRRFSEQVTQKTVSSGWGRLSWIKNARAERQQSAEALEVPSLAANAWLSAITFLSSGLYRVPSGKMTRYICEETGAKNKTPRSELWGHRPFSLHSTCKLDPRVTYRRPALGLSEQFLLHGLFIKLFTSFHVDSTVLNKAADQKKLSTLQTSGWQIGAMFTNVVQQMTLKYSHKCITWEKYHPYSGSHFRPSFRTYLTWPRALCRTASMSAMIQSTARRINRSLIWSIVNHNNMQMFYLYIGD